MIPISGAVLAGGRSSRFGRDKALELWQGKTLLEHALASLEGCAERFIIGGTSERYGFSGVSVHTDLEPFQGSLYGLARALELAQSDRAAVMACDMPGLTREFWNFMTNLEPAQIIIAENENGFLEPLAAIYDRACLPAIRTALGANQLRMTGWHIGLEVRLIPWTALEPQFGPNLFQNLNTQADLKSTDLEPKKIPRVAPRES
jgi:molybdenum cofactor guanylyltransferase